MISLNGSPINITLFPDNTSQVWKIENLGPVELYIEWNFSHEGEFLHLAQLKDLIDKSFTYRNPTVLTISYLPYGRQDKIISNDTTFALHTFAKLLNSLQFEHINITDPHSKEALKLIKNSYPLYPNGEIKNTMLETESTIVCYPDKGALTKYTEVYNFANVYGEKVRDQLTGNITSYKLVGNPKGQNVLIVDDIGDGGMTFKLLAKELLEAGAKEVNLFVSHGIFSRGLRTLKESGINRVFTIAGEVGETQYGFTYRRL